LANPTDRAAPPIRLDLRLDPDRAAAAIGAWPGAALLEGGPGLGEAGRFSILAARPRLVFEATGTRWRIDGPGRHAEAGATDPLGALAALLAHYRLADPRDQPDPGRAPFAGGMIGFFGYDLAPLLERLPRKAPPDSRLPDVRFALYDTALLIDHATGRAELAGFDLLREGRDALRRRVASWRKGLERPADEPKVPSASTEPTSNFSRDDYLAAVGRALEYIAAGDVFQVNLAQRFEANTAADPLALYLRLRRQSPAPFGAFLRWGDLAIVGNSPEWFLRTRGDQVVTRPIKGTRPRGPDPADDARLAAELVESPKDRAELTMIVDLERNDLGRVATYGTVRVAEPMAVESFATVHHLVATIEARLRPGLGPIDLIRATFPGGSITGAPKIRAMQIIDELEPTRRGLYTGAVGYFSAGGASAFNVAIRTLVVEGRRVHYQVGGAIVADSDPAAEYEETLHKGRALRELLAGGPR